MKFRKDVQTGTGTKSYVKLKDQESIKGIFMGEPHEFKAKFDGKKYEISESGSFRFSINFVVKEGAVYVPKIWQAGATVYNDLASLSDEYPLEETVCKITRNGTGTDTTYSIIPTRDVLTPETKAHLKTVKLNSFSEARPSSNPPVNESWPEPSDYQGPRDDDEIPF